jgi:hypothetical protein
VVSGRRILKSISRFPRMLYSRNQKFWYLWRF